MQDHIYKIGLSQKVSFRSKIIFGFLVGMFFVLFGSSVYAGVKSGKLESVLIKPVIDFVNAISFSASISKSDLIDQYPSFTSTSSSEVNIEINTNEKDSSNTNSSDKSFYNYTPTASPYPTIAAKAWEQIKKEQDEQWAKIQDEFKNSSEQSKKNLEQIEFENKKSLEDFRQQGLQSIEQFKIEREQKLQEFKQKYGIE